MGTETNLGRRCDVTPQDIEATRRRIEEKARLVEERVQPRALLRPVKERLESTLGPGGRDILNAFRDHPLPVALTGIGLGWLLLRDVRGVKGHATACGHIGAEHGEPSTMSRAREGASEALEKTKDAVHRAKEGAVDVMHKAKEGAADVMHKAKETAAAIPGKIRQGTRQASDWFSGALEENPVLLAAGALAVGAIAGLCVPVSDKEKEAAEKITDKAAEAVLEEVRPEEARSAAPTPSTEGALDEASPIEGPNTPSGT